MDSADLAFRNKVAYAILANLPTMDVTFELVEHVLRDDVEGDLVECGVYAGGQPAIMSYVCTRYSKRRTIHLFDSFEGIPQAGPMDDESITGLIGKGDGSLRTTGISACSLENVQLNMKKWGVDASSMKYHKGWFQDVLPKTEMGPIALLRLDGDLYESTKVCLKYLYPKVQNGGWVVIDDYALTGCYKAVSEYLASINEKPEIIPIKGGGGPVYWQRHLTE